MKISRRLVDSPVCLVSGEGVSRNGKVISSPTKQQAQLKSRSNPHHDLFKASKQFIMK